MAPFVPPSLASSFVRSGISKRLRIRDDGVQPRGDGTTITGGALRAADSCRVGVTGQGVVVVVMVTAGLPGVPSQSPHLVAALAAP